MRASVVLACVGSLSLCFGGAAVIGLAVVNGTARVDNSSIRGNASILDGSVVETGTGSSQLSLQGGARMEFGSESRGKVFRDRMVLEKGTGQLHASNQYPMLANDLRVIPASSDSTFRVAVKNSKSITVSAVSGQANVMNSHGLLLAKVMPGSTLEFEQDAGAAAQARVSGTVTSSGGKFYLKDDTTGVVSELTCADVSKYKGKKVTVTGSIDTRATPGPGATQVVCVTTGAGGIAPLAGGAGGAAAAGIGGLSAGATAAVVGGVAVAGILIGLGATGNLGNGGNASP